MKDEPRLEALIEADPVAAARLLERLQKYMMVPHEKQREVLEHPARFKILNAGRRFGKTMVGAKAIVTRARKPHRTLWWVAPTYKIVKRGYAEVLKQLPPDLMTQDPPPDSNFDAGRSVILKLKNGTRIEFYSATMPESMLGASVDFVVLDEAATMLPRIWQQIISPTLIDRKGEALMISTPRGLNWFFLEYNRGQDPDKTDYASWTFTSYDNPYLPEGEVERMAENLPQLEVDQEIMARFLSAGSSVFLIPEKAKQDGTVLENGLILDAHGNPVSPDGQSVVLGIDLAKQRDWTVIYGARANDRRNVYFERMQALSWGEQKSRIRRAVRTLKRAGARDIMMVMDSTGVGDPIVDDMEQAGYDVVPVNFSGQHKPNMVKLLARDLERGHAFVMNDEFINTEFQAYTMTVTPAGRYTYSAPEGMHDDVVSAKMLCQHGLVNEGVANVETLGASDTMPEREAADPYGDSEDEDAWDDLVDDDAYDPATVVEDIGYLPPNPSPQELLTRGWF